MHQNATVIYCQICFFRYNSLLQIGERFLYREDAFISMDVLVEVVFFLFRCIFPFKR